MSTGIGRRRIIVAVVATLLISSLATRASAEEQCNNASLLGSYAFQVDGRNVNGPSAAVDQQAGADEEHRRRHHLCHDEHAAHARVGAAGAALPAGTAVHPMRLGLLAMSVRAYDPTIEAGRDTTNAQEDKREDDRRS